VDKTTTSDLTFSGKVANVVSTIVTLRGGADLSGSNSPERSSRHSSPKERPPVTHRGK